MLTKYLNTYWDHSRLFAEYLDTLRFTQAAEESGDQAKGEAHRPSSKHYLFCVEMMSVVVACMYSNKWTSQWCTSLPGQGQFIFECKSAFHTFGMRSWCNIWLMQVCVGSVSMLERFLEFCRV